MIPEKLKKIIILLRDKTLEKKAIWNKTSGDEEYKLIIGEGSSIVVGEHFGNYNHEYIQIVIYNNQGQPVERYSNEEESEPEDNKLVWSFHKAARDSYFKVDETMESLLNEISQQDIIGEKIEPVSPAPSPGEDDDLPF